MEDITLYLHFIYFWLVKCVEIYGSYNTIFTFHIFFAKAVKCDDSYNSYIEDIYIV